MSSYSVQNVSVTDVRRQQILDMQSRIMVYLERCDGAIDEFKEISACLGKYGCASENEEFNNAVKNVKDNINKFVAACSALVGDISDEQVSITRSEMDRIISMFSDVTGGGISREERKLCEVENKAVQQASKLDFHVDIDQLVLEQPKTFKLDSTLVDQANVIVHNKAVFSKAFRDNLKAELELARIQTDESAFKAIESRISKTLSLACEYKEAVTEYKAQCRALKVKPEPVDCTKEGVQKLQELIKANAEVHKKETERQFIQEKFDEAMKSLGYTVYSAGKNGKVETTMYNVTDDIYIETARQKLADGKEQVVVSFAKKEDASEEKLEKSMVKWCSTNRNKLLDALTNYGITAEVKTVLPPKKELVKNIGMATKKQEENTAKSESKKREERRPAAKKMMTMQADKK